MTAPVAAIVGDLLERDSGPGPYRPAPRRDAALQTAYLILASRALGLDCGPIWEFDTRLVDAAFFSGGTVAANFLCALGYGDDSRPAPHQVRPGTAEACNIL